MLAFEVDDMTCGHCVSAITKAIKAVDRGARVEIDLATHRVEVEPTESDAEQLLAAIEEAGYAASPARAPAAPPAPKRSGGCCCN